MRMPIQYMTRRGFECSEENTPGWICMSIDGFNTVAVDSPDLFPYTNMSTALCQALQHDNSTIGQAVCSITQVSIRRTMSTINPIDRLCLQFNGTSKLDEILSTPHCSMVGLRNDSAVRSRIYTSLLTYGVFSYENGYACVRKLPLYDYQLKTSFISELGPIGHHWALAPRSGCRFA